MDLRSRAKELLIGLLVLWGALIVYLATTHEPPRRAPKVYVSGKPAPRTQNLPAAKNGALTIRLDLLVPPPKTAREAKKNIFSPIQIFIPKPPTPIPSATAIPTATPTQRELAEAAARAELATYTYIGYLDRQGRATAVIARGQDIYTVQKGKTVFGSIVLKDVNSDAAVIIDSNTQVESTLPLSGH